MTILSSPDVTVNFSLLSFVVGVVFTVALCLTSRFLLHRLLSRATHCTSGPLHPQLLLLHHFVTTMSRLLAPKSTSPRFRRRSYVFTLSARYIKASYRYIFASPPVYSKSKQTANHPAAASPVNYSGLYSLITKTSQDVPSSFPLNPSGVSRCSSPSSASYSRPSPRSNIVQSGR